MNRMIQKMRTNKLAALVLVAAPILGGIATVWNFRTVYDSLGLPRPVFLGEHRHLQIQLLDLELEYRRSTLRADQKSLRDLNAEMQELIRRGIPIPDGIQDYRSSLEDNIAHNRDRIRQIDGRH